MIETNALVPYALSGIQSYLNSIRKIPMLSAEEEYDLVVRLRQFGDLDAAKQLIKSHLKLAAKIAISFCRYGLPVEDLISEANIGLMQAVKKYEPERGTRLATCAIWWIKASLHEYILRSWSLVKIGTVAAQKKLFYNLRKIKAHLGLYNENSLDTEQVSQIAKQLNVSAKDVIEMDARLAGDISLNTPVYDDGYAEKQDFICDKHNLENDVICHQENAYRLTMLRQALCELNDRERDIIRLRHLTETPATLDELSEKYGISRERVRQIENRAVEKMTNFVQQKQIA